MAQKKVPLSEILSRYIEDGETGCWNYTGTPSSKYGVITKWRNPEKAHRASYRFHVGDIPSGLFVCHRCDNPRCINPEHLFLGTPAENTSDMRAKRRGTFGQTHPMARLSEDHVREVLRNREVPGREFARRLGVSESLISMIRSRKVWAHVTY